MPDTLTSGSVYRWFLAAHIHEFVDGDKNRKRLQSRLLRTDDLSLWDSNMVTADEVMEHCKGQCGKPCGVIEIPVAAFTEIERSLEYDKKDDPKFQHGHVTARPKMNGDQATKILKAAKVVRAHPDHPGVLTHFDRSVNIG